MWRGRYHCLRAVMPALAGQTSAAGVSPILGGNVGIRHLLTPCTGPCTAAAPHDNIPRETVLRPVPQCLGILELVEPLVIAIGR